MTRADELLAVEKAEQILMAHPYTQRVVEAGQAMSLDDRIILYAKEGIHRLTELNLYREIPVDPRTFVESPEYLNRKGNLYPVVMECFVELNSGKYDTAVLTGSIGSGKTSLANYTQAYQLYLLSVMRNPQKYFGLMDTDEIVIIMQSKTWRLASSIDYRRFRALITTAPYFKTNFMFDEDLTSELIFPNRIIVKPVAGTDTAALSQNVFSASIDEINFMEVVERSKQSRGGDKEVFDQARELHRTITTRRESRFMATGGRVPGLVCVLSSKQYPGEFTDRLTQAAQDEIATKGFTRTYLYDKRYWEIRPDKFLDSLWFRIWIGDETRQPRIIGPDEFVADEDRHLVMEIPEEYRKRFEDDLLDAMRDIAGVSTQALHPFIPNTSKMAKCFGKVKSILTLKTCDFLHTKPGIILDNIRKPNEPRWIHIDLGLRSDSAGVSCGFVDRFVELKSSLDVQTELVEKEEFEIMPVIRYDFNLEVRPPKGGEISFESIRQLIYLLKKEGVNIKWVTLDSWQSTDTLQILKQKGYIVGIISMDKPLTVQDESGMLPYILLKHAFMDGRIEAPIHEKCLTELSGLQFDAKKRKIDHRPNGSKDVSDSMAGVCRGLTMSLAVWAWHHVATRLPKRLVDEAKKVKMQEPVPVEQISWADRRGDQSSLRAMRESARGAERRGRGSL